MDESSRLASLSEILTYEGKAPVENLSISEGDRSPEVNSRLLACKRTWAYDSPVALILGLLIVGLCGCIIALISPVPADEEDSSQSRWGAMSRTIGATYCLCWSLSFYPQVNTLELGPCPVFFFVLPHHRTLGLYKLATSSTGHEGFVVRLPCVERNRLRMLLRVHSKHVLFGRSKKGIC